MENANKKTHITPYTTYLIVWIALLAFTSIQFLLQELVWVIIH